MGKDNKMNEKQNEENSVLDEWEKQIDIVKSATGVYVVYILIVIMFIIVLVPIFKNRSEVNEKIKIEVEKQKQERKKLEENFKKKQETLDNMPK